ncbi:MAG: efflux transporter outer membrane subunit [Candidatus Acidiferrales bacterium]
MARKLSARWIWLAGVLLFMDGCMVGPAYHTPTVTTPPAYKELTPEQEKVTDGWKVAQPKDDALHGKWWEIFGDPELNALEEQVNVSNQNIAMAAANFQAARALVRQARAQLFPTATTNPSITAARERVASSTTNASGTTSTTLTSANVTEYQLPFDATWQPDLFGRIRNTVRAAAAGAQVDAADLENTRLTVQAEVASDYFQLRSQDALKQLLDDTVAAYKQSLDLTQVLYETGIDSEESVSEAETQLESTEAQDTNIGIQRAQFEHAIAMLVGQPASTFAIPQGPLKVGPPAIPYGVPSQLLERRPDIAAAERGVAQANAQIGVARSAYFPTLTLSGSVGFEAAAFSKWLSPSSFVWSVGPALAETLFDAGLRRATVAQYQAQYDSTVANYRETVLTAFQQVEDNLASLRILSVEIQQQDVAVASAEHTLQIATDRYKLGIDPYLNVITAQTALFSNRQTAVTLRSSQMTAGVQLIEALGGSWDVSQLPSMHSTMVSAPTTPPPTTAANAPATAPQNPPPATNP